MFRRLFRSWLGITLALVALATTLTIIVIIMQLSNGSLVISPSPKANTFITPPSDTPADSTLSDAPSDTPPTIANSIIPYSAVALDTTGFDRPASVQGWELGEKHDYVTVTIALSKKDWQVIASQLHLDPTTDPSRLQLDQTTASSLISIDQLAEDVIKNCQNYHVPTVDIRKLNEGYYLLAVDS